MATAGAITAALAGGASARFVQFARPPGQDWHADLQVGRATARVPLAVLARYHAQVEGAPELATLRNMAKANPNDAQRVAERAQAAKQDQKRRDANALADRQAPDRVSFWSDLSKQAEGQLAQALGISGKWAKVVAGVVAGVVVLKLLR